MNEWKRIISARKRLAAIVCLPIVCTILFFYNKCDGNFDSLIPDARNYRDLIEVFTGCTPPEIISVLSENKSPNKEEQRLLAQAIHLQDYSEYLDSVQGQANKMQTSSIFNENKNSFTYRNILKTARDFANCTSKNVYIGNDRAVQDWLSFSLSDWGFLAAILLLIMSFSDERKKGLSAIIRTCPAGRAKLQLCRVAILFIYCAGMTLLLYYLPLFLSLLIDGGYENWYRPIQSLAEFKKCTAQISIADFLILYFFVKTLCGFFIGVFIWFVLSFLYRPQMGWLAIAMILVVEYLLYSLIPMQSILSPLREINLFSYIFTFRLFTQYVNINFFGFPVGRRALLFVILFCSVTSLSFITVLMISRRFPFGNRDILGKWVDRWNLVGDTLRKHLPLYGFEVYKFLVLGVGGIFLIMGFLLSRNLICGTTAYLNGEDGIYRQYIEGIQGPVTQDTYAFLAHAREALTSDSADTIEYEIALDRIEDQLGHLEEGAWIVYEPKFLNCYGIRSSVSQRQNAVLAFIFLTSCLPSIYSCEYDGDVAKLICSTPGGRRKLFWQKYMVAITIMIIAWIRIMYREWQLSIGYMGQVIALAPCSSISITRHFTCTIKEALFVLYLFKLICLLIPVNFCVFICERCQRYEKAFILCSLILLLPAAMYYFGADSFACFTPASLLADCSPIFYGTRYIPIFVLWMILSLLSLFAAERQWSKTPQ